MEWDAAQLRIPQDMESMFLIDIERHVLSKAHATSEGYTTELQMTIAFATI